MLAAWPDPLTAHTVTVADEGIYPESLPGSRSIPAVLEAVVPHAYLRLTVLELSASTTNPTAFVGGVKVIGVVPTELLFVTCPFVFFELVTVPETIQGVVP